MDIILEQFKTIFDRPEKVKKLRETILDLAVRGKLVKQDPNDEPASILLERIREEKERLIKEKKIKKEKPLEEISEEEKPYELPEGWEFIRLGNLGITQTGTTPSTKNEEYFNGTVPFIKPADISEKGINYENESLTELGLIKGRLILKNSVMMVCIGGSIGKNYYTSMDCSCNQQINTITPLANIDSKFVHYLLSNSNFYNKILELSTGSATPIINKSKWEQIIIPLPPFEEQKRIVQKVDSLMDFCDKLEKSLEKKVHYGSLSAKSIFNAVGNVSTVEELEETLRFILLNFKDLYLGDNAIKELKNCILQLAVQGKLVKQDPNDECAEVLLEKIREEKERLVKEKKIKKEKPLKEISEEEKSFELPEGWEYTRLAEIAEFQKGFAFKSSEYRKSGVQITKVSNLNNLKTNDIVYINSELKSKYEKFELLKDDIVLTTVGSWPSCQASVVGNTIYIEGLFEGTLLNQNAVRLRTTINSKYMYTVLKSNKFRNYIINLAQGTANQASITQESIKSFIFLLPPLEEQKRIVEKVDSLMTLCDELEKKIEKQKEYSNRLMQSILKKEIEA